MAAIRLFLVAALASFGTLACAPGLSAPDLADGSAADEACLETLAGRGVEFDRVAETRDVRTPIVLRDRLGALELEPRGQRPALMDCTLAKALLDSSPVFERLGLTRLAYSAAYDHRTRRGSTRLSAHARGRAIDVHAFGGRAGPHDVAADFEGGVGRWIDLRPADGAYETCLGAPRTRKGRALRALVCELKLTTALRTIVTPDDDDDHRDHVHLEVTDRPRSAVARATSPPPVRVAKPTPRPRWPR